MPARQTSSYMLVFLISHQEGSFSCQTNTYWVSYSFWFTKLAHQQHQTKCQHSPSSRVRLSQNTPPVDTHTFHSPLCCETPCWASWHFDSASQTVGNNTRADLMLHITFHSHTAWELWTWQKETPNQFLPNNDVYSRVNKMYKTQALQMLNEPQNDM